MIKIINMHVTNSRARSVIGELLSIMQKPGIHDKRARISSRGLRNE
jgi:hypothetical protein